MSIVNNACLNIVTNACLYLDKFSPRIYYMQYTSVINIRGLNLPNLSLYIDSRGLIILRVFACLYHANNACLHIVTNACLYLGNNACLHIATNACLYLANNAC